MKIFHLFLIALLAVPATSFAQKLDIDGKKVKTNYLRLPNNVVPEGTKTFSVKAEGLYNVTDWGFDADAVKAEFLKLDGYESVATDGDVRLEMRMAPIRFVDFIINSIKNESKDSKTGRITTTYTYNYVITYEKGFTAKLFDKANKVIWDMNKGLSGLMSNTTSKYTSQTTFSSYKAASDEYHNRRVELQREIAGREIRSGLDGIRDGMNRAYGFSEVTETFTIYTTDTKKHPENDAFIKAYEDTKALFAQLSGAPLNEESMSAFAPVIDYYKSTAEKYKADEKSDIKLRYACYYNLANIALYLDRPDETILWAKKLVENDYDKKDGKNLTEDAEKLQELLKKHKVSSRRFTRA